MVGLLLPPLILLVDVGLLLAIAAVRRPAARWVRWVAAAGVGAALVLLLTGGKAIPYRMTPWSSMSILTPSLTLQRSETGRLLGLSLTALVLASILAAGRRQEAEGSAVNNGVAWALLLATLAAGLVATMPANILTLALAWTVLDSALAVAWLYPWFRGEQFPSKHRALTSWGLGAAGTLFLWSATLPLQAHYAFQSTSSLVTEGWVGMALTLAIILRLAPLHFNLPRPGTPQQSASTTSLHIIPTAAGIGLLAQLSNWTALPLFWRPLLSTLILSGLVGSSLLAWFSKEARHAAGWILTGQVSVTVLVGLWVGPEAALAEGLVLILAGGLLGLLASLETVSVENKIALALGAAALAGLPLTWGSDGRLALYQRWLADGLGLYLVLAAGAYLLLLAVAGRLLLRPHTPAIPLSKRIAAGMGLGLLALGLLFRSGPLVQANILVWLALLLPIAGAVLLTWGADQLRPLQEQIASWLQLSLSLNWLFRLLGNTLRWVGRAVHAAHQVIEGEGALLWALILLAMGWLLLASRSPG